MKKTITKTLLLAALLICYVTNISAAVYTGSCGNSATYSLNTETGLLEIKGSGSMIYPYAPWYSYSSSVKEVKISDKITSIGSGAFSSCYGLTSVTIGNSVTSIGSLAFSYCYSLTSVTIPNSVTSIGSSAFESCSGLTSVTIPNSVTSIGDNAFKGCTGLTSVTIPNSVTSIGSGAFFGCYRLYEIYNLSNINIVKGSSDYGGVAFYAQIVHNSLDEPSAYKQAGDFLFIDSETPKLVSYTGKATNITLPNDFNGSNYSIGYSAFRGCSSLTSVTIPNSVTSIGDYAFCNCSGLTSITIPNSVTSIGSGAFYNCSGLTSVTIPNSVTSIGSMVFSDCYKLYEVYNLSKLNIVKGSSDYGRVAYYAQIVHNFLDEPSIYKQVGDFLFIDSEIPSLVSYKGQSTNITLPNDFNGRNYSIGSYAFYKCSGLTSVTIPNSVTSIGFQAFYYCSGLTSVTIGNSVTSIGDYAFYYCSGLTSVTIGNSVTSIGDDAFYKCSGIKDIINLSSTPQSDAGTLPTTATVHVLYGCKSAYKASSAWRNYNIVEDVETLFSLESVSFEKEKMYVNIGAEFKLTPVINPSFIPASNYDIIWKTSNSSVLSYDQTSQQFIAKQEGVVTVSVRVIDSNDKIVSAQMTVYVGESYPSICAAPVITYTDGEIKCVSETESATCHYEYEITTPSGSGENSCRLSPKLIVKAYATAEDYEDSDVVTKTFDLNAGSGLKGDVNGDGKVTMQDANEVLNIYLGK